MSEPASFRFEQFEDYLTFERGLSDRTIAAYLVTAGSIATARR